MEWWNGGMAIGARGVLTSSFDTETARWYGVKQYTMGVAKEKDATRGADGGDSRPTSALLMSASKHISLQCRKVNEAYIACKDRNHGNPSACLQEGEAVTACTVAVLTELNTTCPEQLRSYCECMDYYSNRFAKCRKEQEAFETCAPL